jgi:methionine-rich copper-binding protein CopC
MSRQTKRIGLVAAMAIVSWGSLLVAHMRLFKSEPAADAVLTAPPRQVRLVFTELPDLEVSKLEIAGPSPATKLGPPRVIEQEKILVAEVEGEVPDGAYTVLWQSAGNDGHVQRGELKFSVKHR